METLRNFLKRLLPKGSAMRHVSVLAGGTAVAQGLGIAVMPIISRIYSPADFGVMAVFASVTAILTELSGFRYHLAIPLPKQDRYAKALVVLSFLLQAVFVVFISVAILVLGKTILLKIAMEVLIPYRYLIPIGVAGMGAYIALTQWAIREKLFQVIARTRVTQSVSGILTKVILGLLGLKPLGLLLGSVASQAGGITTLARSILKKKGFPKPPKEDIKRVAFRYRRFPMYNTWSGLFDSLGRQIIPVLIVALFSTQIAGWFSLSFQVLQLPAVFIGQAIGQVFFQKAAEAKFEGTLSEVSNRTFRILLEIAIFPILSIAILAPELFIFVFGSNWETAGLFSRYLAPWIMFMFVFSPISSLFYILERQREFLFFQIINLFGRVLMIYLGFWGGNPLLSVFLYGFFSLGFVIFILFWVLGKSSIPLMQLFKVFFGSFVRASFLLLPLFVVHMSQDNLFVSIALAIIVFPLYLINVYRALEK